MKRAIGYIRVSTTKQAEEGISLQAQKDVITSWAKMNGYDLVKIYTDKESGSAKCRHKRVNLDKAISKLSEGDVLVAYKLSRLARSLKDTLLINEAVEAMGGSLAIVKDNIDNSTPMGKFIFQILASVNELELATISENTKNALQAKRARGERYAREIPYGYSLEGDKLIHNPKESKAIDEILRLKSEGKTLRDIADILNRAGVKPRRSAKWSHSSVAYIINNPR